MAKSGLKWALLIIPFLAMSCEESIVKENGVKEGPTQDVPVRYKVSSITKDEYDGNFKYHFESMLTYEGDDVSDVTLSNSSIHYNYYQDSVVGVQTRLSDNWTKYKLIIENKQIKERKWFQNGSSPTIASCAYFYDNSGLVSSFKYTNVMFDATYRVTWDAAHENIVALKTDDNEMYFEYDDNLNPFIGRTSNDYYIPAIGGNTAVFFSLITSLNKNNITKMGWTKTPYGPSEVVIAFAYTYGETKLPVTMDATLQSGTYSQLKGSYAFEYLE
jgi:hypothetical protein